MSDRRVVLGAYRVVLRNVAQWRHTALGNREEFNRRDRFLTELERIATATSIRLTGSVLPDLKE